MQTNQKTSSFDRAMKQIENEFETQRVEEIRAAQRALLYARLRKVAVVLMLLGLSGAAFAYRADIKSYVEAKFIKPADTAAGSGDSNTSCTNGTSTATSKAPKGAAASAVNAAQANAKVRDEVIDSMMK